MYNSSMFTACTIVSLCTLTRAVSISSGSVLVRAHSQKSQRRIWRGDVKRYSGHEQHYPRQARIAPGAGATHHACPAWSPCWGGEQSSLGGAGQAAIICEQHSQIPKCFFLFFSRALGKASRAQRPHKTHRLISPPLWDQPPRGLMAVARPASLIGRLRHYGQTI